MMPQNDKKLTTAFAKAKGAGLERRISLPLLEKTKVLEELIDNRLKELEEEFFKKGKKISSSKITITSYNPLEISEECLKTSEGYQEIHKIASKRNVAIKIRNNHQESGSIFIDLDDFYENSSHAGIHKNNNERFDISRPSSNDNQKIKKPIVLKTIPDLKK